MSYTHSVYAQKLVDDAHTMLLLYFLDSNVRTQYGRHSFKSNCPAKNPRAVELWRHERIVAKNQQFIKVALIYDLRTGEEINRFKRGSGCRQALATATWGACRRRSGAP